MGMDAMFTPKRQKSKDFLGPRPKTVPLLVTGRGGHEGHGSACGRDITWKVFDNKPNRNLLDLSTTPALRALPTSCFQGGASFLATARNVIPRYNRAHRRTKIQVFAGPHPNAQFVPSRRATSA
jgi:hypothetical protein